MSDDSRDLSRRTVLGAFGTDGVTTGLGATSATAERGKGGGCPGADHLAAPAPGPDVLYEDPVSAAKLAPGDGWDAEQLLVSGGEAYVGGEYLYYGWVHDDYGDSTPERPAPSRP